ncbi:MAG: fibronectin type III domain-containing protein [Candidatus Komeilibacteria bacterium]
MVKNKVFSFFIVLLLLLSPILARATDWQISDISISNLLNGRATLQWSTFGMPTRATIYYGSDPDNLTHSIGYGSFAYSHTTYLTGLAVDTDYYYKIYAWSADGQNQETFILTFNTDDMVDTERPTIISEEILQVTRDAVALTWQTNELTKAEISYGPNSDDWDKTSRYNSYDIDHDFIITGLTSYQNYYLRIKVYDKAGNERLGKLWNFNTTGSYDRLSDLQIDNIEPLSFDPNMIFADSAIIAWETNLVARGSVYYGTESGHYNKRVDVNQDKKALAGRAILRDLQPGTVYYYKIKAYDSLYNKRVETVEHTFVTVATQPNESAIIIEDQPSGLVDADSDGLLNDYENSIGTNPLVADTDGDGYPDGLEVSNGYNPLGTGRWQESAFAYGKPRASLAVEQNAAQYLRQVLQANAISKALPAATWYRMINAYVYGNYPVEAIVQAVRWGGKTVHPTIPWSAWRHSFDYNSYIDR